MRGKTKFKVDEIYKVHFESTNYATYVMIVHLLKRELGFIGLCANFLDKPIPIERISEIGIGIEYVGTKQHVHYALIKQWLRVHVKEQHRMWGDIANELAIKINPRIKEYKSSVCFLPANYFRLPKNRPKDWRKYVSTNSAEDLF